MTYEEATNNTSCKKIMNFFNKKLTFLEHRERHTFKEVCLWQACRTFDSTKASFITHLFNTLKYTTLKEYGKFKENRIVLPIQSDIDNSDNLLKCRLVDHIDSLLPIYKDIIEKRFIMKLSLREIAKEYNINMNECKSLIERAKESLKNSLQEIAA